MQKAWALYNQCNKKVKVYQRFVVDVVPQVCNFISCSFIKNEASANPFFCGFWEIF